MNDTLPGPGRLLADVGGTNARFAHQTHAGAPITDLRVLPCAAYPRLQDAVRDYLDHIAPRRVDSAAIAIANPVSGDAVRMTNHHWSFSQRALQAELGLRTLCVLNDFTALALALPALPPHDLRAVGAGQAVPGAPKALLGAGTGLGVSGLLPDGHGGWIALQGEGGHVTLPAQTARERLVMDGLAQRHGHVSAERVCSGAGLFDTFTLLCAADGSAVQGIADPAAVVDAALGAGQPQALEALRLFCGLLGSVAGNLALTLGAHGGVYVGGGIAPRLGTWFDSSPFRERFEAKGRFRALLQGIPTWVITAAQSPALLGAARALDAHAARAHNAG